MKRVPIPTCLLQISHWLFRVQTRASALRGEWLNVSLHEQINYFPDFEGKYVPKTRNVQNSPFPTWRASISKERAEIHRQCALSDGHFICLLFCARNVFVKRNLESGTSLKCVTSVFSIIACSHACRATHRQYVPKYDKWVEVIFLSYKSTQIPQLPDALSSADSWWNG